MRNPSPKNKRFIAEFLKDQNGTQAAIRAGYSKKTARAQACDLLTKPYIKNAIDEALRKASENALVDATYVISSLKEVAERCMERKPVMEFDREEKCMVQKTDGDGEGVWEFDSAGANRALELLGKYLALFTDKSDLTVRQPEPIQFVPIKSKDASDRGK